MHIEYLRSKYKWRFLWQIEQHINNQVTCAMKNIFSKLNLLKFVQNTLILPSLMLFLFCRIKKYDFILVICNFSRVSESTKTYSFIHINLFRLDTLWYFNNKCYLFSIPVAFRIVTLKYFSPFLINTLTFKVNICLWK